MVYLPIKKLKIYLIIIFALASLQLACYSTKTYTVSHGDFHVSNVNEEIYLNYLGSMPIGYKTEFIDNTEIKYINFLPESSLFIIYIGYFIVVTGLILSAKIKLNE